MEHVGPLTNQDPILDPERIKEIARLRLHEDQVDEILNEYVKKAADEFNLPIGVVSIVLDDIQSFIASHGLEDWVGEVKGTPVEWAFCANSVRSGEEFVVEDSHESVMKDSPIVTMEGIRCYAGVPLITEKGKVIGNFCVQGPDTRSFTEGEILRLKEYAQLVMNRLEERVR